MGFALLNPSYKPQTRVALEIPKGCYKNQPFVSGIPGFDEESGTRWKNSLTSFNLTSA
jgi:hypothetical protein